MCSAAAARGWREAAALIAVSKAGAGGGDMEVLLQTRPAAGSFRNSVVFPGGVCERADGAAGWLRLLAAFGYSHADLAELHHPPPRPAPLPLLLRPDPLLRQLSLRITAIRETFEELGVLVCSRTHKNQRTDTTALTPATATPITDFDVSYWQKRVSKEPAEFLSLCEALRCCPDVWALRWWSNWLTPAYLRTRFDTAFFLTEVTWRPPLHPSSEVVKAEWARADAVLRRRGLVVYPPQAYELVLLSRGVLSRPRPRPVRPPLYHAAVRASGALLHVFPGDDLYPESIDYSTLTELSSDLSAAQLREQARVAHRIETVGETHTLVFKNYDGMDLLAVPINLTFS